MEVKTDKPTSEWCFLMRDEAYAKGNVSEAEDYHKLGQMWEEREKAKGVANETTKESNQQSTS